MVTRKNNFNMSTDCESVVSPSICPDSRSREFKLSPTRMRNELRSSPDPISYEGTLSLIPPRYETTGKPLYGYECSTATQFPPNPNQDQMREAIYSAYLRNNYPLIVTPQNHATPGSSKDIINEYNPILGKRYEVKQEIDQGYKDTEHALSNYVSKNNDVKMNDFTDSLKDENEKEIPLNNINGNNGKISPILKIPLKTNFNNGESSLNYEELPVEGIPDNYSFITHENEERSCSPASDQEAQRDMDTDSTSLLNNYLDTTQDIIQHGDNAKSIKCNYCSYSTDFKHEFNNHLNIHFDHKCMMCEFSTQTVEQLKDHLKEDHNLSSEVVVDFESSRIPRVNSQGKIKTFKCKQCDHSAITKSDFWDHNKTHIKSGKLLECPKCKFVTEYKHHFEYHLRTHSGNKPYSCTKCKYSCVNKSMLNSHMKSHSSVYQYRCNDCSYATKYCHSLKLHLRKYKHTPAMVLNPDGTPNPVPIIDVYGTRRGPKLKKDENGMPILPPQYQIQAEILRAQMEVTGTLPPAPTVPTDKYINKSNGFNINLPMPSASFPNPFNFAGILQNRPSIIPNEFIESEPAQKPSTQDEEENNSGDKIENLNVSKSPEVQETFKCVMCSYLAPSKDVLSHHMLLHAQEKEKLERDMSSTVYGNGNTLNHNFSEQIPNSSYLLNDFEKLQQGYLRNIHSHTSFQEYLARAFNPLAYSQLMGTQGFVYPALGGLQQQLQRLGYSTSESNKEKSLGVSLSPVKPPGSTETVLDLSKEHTPPSSGASQQNSSSISPSQLPASPPNSDVSTPPSKNRRKGRAYKLERVTLRLGGSGEENGCDENSETRKEQEEKRAIGNIPSLLPLPQQSQSNNDCTSADTNCNWKIDNQCNFCGIAFRDEVLYTMHMGYHGYQNPYTCNSCGFEAKDKIEFFIHLARSSHR